MIGGQALTFGVVLSAKDMYSRMFAKATSDLKQLSKTSATEAAAFERNLRIGKTMMVVGGTVTAAGLAISRVFENVVQTAGEMDTALNEALIAAGENAGVTREQMQAMFSAVKVGWGMLDQEIKDSYKEIGGRTQDWVGALGAVERASALARARTIPLAEATEYLTTMVMQQSDAEKEGLSLQERYTRSAAQLAYIQKNVGSGFAIIGSGLGRITEKTRAAGVPFAQVGALLMEMGRAGVSARSGIAPIEAMLDAVRKLPAMGGFGEVFPKFAKSGSLVDMLDEVKARLDLIPDGAKKLEWLNHVFGSGAEMVLGFTQNMDKIRKGTADLEEQGKQIDGNAGFIGKANEQMTTWAGTQARFNARMEEFKEMLGTGAIPMVKRLENALGAITEATGKSPFWRAVLTGGFLWAGYLGELAKLAGPIIAAIGWWTVYQTQQKVALALQLQLNAATAAGAAGVGAGAATGAGAAAGGAAVGIGARMAGAASAMGRFVGGISPVAGGAVGFLANPTVVGREWAGGTAPWNAPGFVPAKVTLNVTVQSTGDARRDGYLVGSAAADELEKRLVREQRGR